MQKQTITLSNNIQADLYKCDVLIVGSGAAGLNCADRLFDAGITDIAILTTDLYGGTSYRSGSDKQTYYKMSLFGDATDSPKEMAQSLFNGGAMHGDIAYVESVSSLPAFFKLVDNGVPFPHNGLGAYVGYKTDHDPRQRATSAGPKTSNFMVECALRKVKHKRIPIFENTTVVRIAVSGEQEKKVCGIVALSGDLAGAENLGVTLFSAGAVVLATGGPGELYGASVYPCDQVSLHGVALEAGASLVNLGESQFGITSTKFRWNLSGTYQQVLPAYYSVDNDGNKHNFLAKYYRNTSEMASNIFLKGYQWPFSAGRSEGFGSSLVDIAVDAEIRAGRKVYMDFINNPEMNSEALDISKLTDEARIYLVKSEALQDNPYDRLAWMNPDSIDIYTKNSVDLNEPLEIAVSFQHNNGGISISNVYQTDIPCFFAIGEIAGAHGVSRPGGSALNSGQVGGIRVTQYLKSKGIPSCDSQAVDKLVSDARSVFNECKQMLQSGSRDHREIRTEIQHRMTSHAGFLRNPEVLGTESERAASLAADTMSGNIAANGKHELARAWETRNLALTSAAFMKTIAHYVDNGGGSRGSYLIVSKSKANDAQTGVVDTASGPLFAYRKENLTDKGRQIKVSGVDTKVSVETVRPIPEDTSWYETTWAEYREGKLF